MRPASSSPSPSQANLGGEAVQRAAEAEEKTGIEEESKRRRDTTWMSGEGTRRKARKGAKPPSVHQLNVIKRDMLRAMIRESGGFAQSDDSIGEVSEYRIGKLLHD